MAIETIALLSMAIETVALLSMAIETVALLSFGLAANKSPAAAETLR